MKAKLNASITAQTIPLLTIPQKFIDLSCNIDGNASNILSYYIPQGMFQKKD